MYVALFVVVVILALLLGRIPPAAHVDFEAGATESGPDLSANAIESSPEPELRSDTSGLYLIIDDVGNNLSALADYLDLQIDITFAVLPGRRHTVESVRRIREAGQAVILHQPMEPVGAADHGQLGLPARQLLQDDAALSQSKIALARAVAVVISAGLGILGVTPVEEMR